MGDVFLEAAIEEARKSRAEGGIPIGSVLVHGGRILGRGHNQRIQKSSAILHAEIDALNNAGRQPPEVYRDSVLYTTLSPCPMCSGAIRLFRIPCVVIGENQTFRGDEELLRREGVQLEIRNDPACLALMQAFLAEEPELWREDISVESR